MIQEHLTLELLAPYLPYKLYVLHFGERKVLNTGYGSSVNWIGMSAALKFKDPQKLRPLLHPLSRLMEEIEVDGKKFVPMMVLFGCSVKEEEAFDIYGTIPVGWDIMFNIKNFVYWDYKLVVLLLKWHFDIFGLLDKGLAEEIKTDTNG